MKRCDEVWKSPSLAKTFLEGVRGGIPFAAEQIGVMLKMLEAQNEPIERFLDLGCGGGALAVAIFERYPNAACVLLDFSEPMIEEAKKQLSGHADRTEFVIGDFGAGDWVRLVVADGPFDAIVSGYAIHHQTHERKRELYGEIFGLVRPGGVFINVEHVQSNSRWIESIWDESCIDSLYAFHQREGTEKTREQVAEEFYHRDDKEANILAPVEVQCEWLRECGFEDVDCFFKFFELAVFGGRRPAG